MLKSETLWRGTSKNWRRDREVSNRPSIRGPNKISSRPSASSATHEGPLCDRGIGEGDWGLGGWISPPKPARKETWPCTIESPPNFHVHPAVAELVDNCHPVRANTTTTTPSNRLCRRAVPPPLAPDPDPRIPTSLCAHHPQALPSGPGRPRRRHGSQGPQDRHQVGSVLLLFGSGHWNVGCAGWGTTMGSVGGGGVVC